LDAFEVIGSLRQAVLELKLEVARLQSQMSMLERFTWNIVKELPVGARYTREDYENVPSNPPWEADRPQEVDLG